MNIPDEVKVGFLDYTVEKVPEPFCNGSNAVDGTENCSNALIRVAESGCADYQNMVFLHELLHAIDFVYCGETLTEKQIAQMSKGLYQVIKDNPEIFK